LGSGAAVDPELPLLAPLVVVSLPPPPPPQPTRHALADAASRMLRHSMFVSLTLSPVEPAFFARSLGLPAAGPVASAQRMN
jgi:hypothetical protein